MLPERARLQEGMYALIMHACVPRLRSAEVSLADYVAIK